MIQEQKTGMLYHIAYRASFLFLLTFAFEGVAGQKVDPLEGGAESSVQKTRPIQAGEISPFDWLSSEIVKEILKFVPLKDISNVGHTCKALFNIAFEFERKVLRLKGEHVLSPIFSEMLKQMKPYKTIDSCRVVSPLNPSQTLQNLLRLLPGLTDLKELYLGDMQLSSEQLGALAPYLPVSLERLNLQGNAIGDLDVERWAPKLPQSLKSLNLLKNAITDVGVKVLMNNIPPFLEELSLGENPLTNDGIAYTIKRLPKTLTKLGLSNLGINHVNMELLAENLPPSLVFLDISFNPIIEKSMNDLVQKFSESLKRLDMRSMGITDAILKILTENLPPSLERIYLSGNIETLSDEAIKALQNKKPSLKIL